PEFSGGFCHALRIERHNNHPGAFGRVSVCAITSDATGTAGEKNDFILKGQIHASEKSNISRRKRPARRRTPNGNWRAPGRWFCPGKAHASFARPALPLPA